MQVCRPVSTPSPVLHTDMYRLIVINILIYYIYLAIYNFTVVFRRVGKIAKRDYKLHHMCLSIHPSVCPHGTTRLPLDGF